MSEEEKVNGEFATKLTVFVQSFAALDGACDKIREKGICDAVGVKCDVSCKIYVKKDKLLKFFEECLKAPTAADLPSPFALQPGDHTAIPLPERVPECEPHEKPKERLCPSCNRNPARPDSKYCDYCGEEL